MQPDQPSSLTSNQACQKFKIVFVGNSGVGKTSIVQRIVTNSFDDRKQQTIAIDFLKKRIVHNKAPYQLMLWDTAGQQKFNSLISSYIRGAHCVIAMYDVGDLKSFSDCSNWINIVKQTIGNQHTECSMILVGNKSDISEKQKIVKYQTGFQWALKNKMSFVEVSAKSGSNMDNLIHQIVQSIERKFNSASTIDSEQKMAESIATKIAVKTKKIEQNICNLKIRDNKKNSCCSI